MQQKNSPKISVLLTVRDGENFLDRTLESIAQQTVTDWEAILVDDGSQDSTPDILARYANKDERFRVISLPPSGRIIALNRGLEACRGTFIAIQDGDDIATPNRLEKEVRTLESDTKLGMVASFADIIDESGAKTGEQISSPTTDSALRNIFLRYNPIVHSSVMYRTSVLDRVPRYTERFLPGFEWEMYANIMKHASISVIPESLILYRVHANSLTKKRSRLKRLVHATRARWYVFRTLNYSITHAPELAFGLLDLLPTSVKRWKQTL